MNESNQSEMDWGYYIKAPEIGNQYLYFSCSLINYICMVFFFFSSRRRHTRFDCHWSSDVCSSDLGLAPGDILDAALANTGAAPTRPSGWQGIAADWSSDQRAFKNVSWGKAMMWIFLLSDTFIFSCFLLSYMTVRMSTTVPWPNPSEVFALTIGGTSIPLILIAIMTFILISSSGTMAMAVNFGYRRDRVKTAALMLATAAFGATFVGMQAFDWTKLIMEGEIG